MPAAIRCRHCEAWIGTELGDRTEICPQCGKELSPKSPVRHVHPSSIWKPGDEHAGGELSGFQREQLKAGKAASVREVAEFFRVSAKTVKRWQGMGCPCTVESPHRVWFVLADVREWLRVQTVAAGKVPNP